MDVIETKDQRYNRLVNTPERQATILTIEEQYDRIRYLSVREVKILYPLLTPSFEKEESQKRSDKALKGVKQVYNNNWYD